MDLTPTDDVHGFSGMFGNFFRGEISQTAVCGKCKHRSIKPQIFMDLQLDITKANSIEEAIAYRFLLSNQPTNNRCDVCHEMSSTEVSESISRAPKILWLQLLRYSVMIDLWPIKEVSNLNIFCNVRA